MSDLPRLSSPQTLAVVIPSSAPLARQNPERGLASLREMGFAVRSFYDADAKVQRFAGTDAARAASMTLAAEDTEAGILMALRGGYGFSRLMHLVNWDAFAAAGKTCVGYSDFTLCHQQMLRRGVPSLAGPMLCDDALRDPLHHWTLQQFVDVLEHDTHRLQFRQTEAIEAGMQVAEEGRLWGGNLAMLVHTLGTPYWHEEPNGILFLEDIGEHPYRVERMLLQMHYAGVLNRQKAIVLGDFSGYKLAEHDQGYDFAVMLAYIRSLVTVPVVTGLPFGHIPDRATLVVGSQAQLLAQGAEVSLTMHYRLPHLASASR